MADPFLAEIRIFAGNFAPRGWATCDGQLIAISQNTALFALLGTNFGGDGRSTFGLPNLQSSVPMHTSQYSNSPLGTFYLGQRGGEAAVTLQSSELAAHPHNLMAANLDATTGTPGSNEALGRPSPSSNTAYQSTATDLVPMGTGSTDFTGGGQPHNNLQPYLTFTFIIALQGVFPQRP